MLTRWCYSLNALMITRLQYCLSGAAMITRWHYCTNGDVRNERLTVFIDSNQIMSKDQAGVRKGYSTTDQIFTLKCIVELFLCQGRILFCTFVDYSKAFDSINRATLWKKTNIMWYIRKSPSYYIKLAEQQPVGR